MGFIINRACQLAPFELARRSPSFSSCDPVYSPASEGELRFLQSNSINYVPGSISLVQSPYIIMKIIFTIVLILGIWIALKVKTFLSYKSHLRAQPKPCPASGEQKDELLSHQESSEETRHDLPPPFKLPPLKPATSLHMTMGLKRLDQENWLTLDENYLDFHRIRSRLLMNHKSSVVASLPPASSACHEVLSLVAAFLSKRFPTTFEIHGEDSSAIICNRQTGEYFPLVNNSDPLETAARLAMEDFNVLMKDEKGVWRLQASATLFPAGWTLQERIGGTLDILHGPVPKWSQKLGGSVSRYFDHLSSKTSMERLAFFVQTDGELFQATSLAHPSSGASDDLHPRETEVTPTTIHVRRERQTFIPLPLSTASTGQKTILFGVRTWIQPLTALRTDEIEALVSIAEGWTEEVARYKGRDGWLDVVRRYLRERKLS